MASFLLPSVQQAYGTSYIQAQLLIGFLYDVSNGILYTIYPTENYDVFLKVPSSIAQLFAVARKQLGGSYQNPNIPDPDAIFVNSVMSVNPGELLSEPDGDYLSTPNGYDLSITQPDYVSQFPRCLLCENGAPLLAENGDYLVLT